MHDTYAAVGHVIRVATELSWVEPITCLLSSGMHICMQLVCCRGAAEWQRSRKAHAGFLSASVSG